MALDENVREVVKCISYLYNLNSEEDTRLLQVSSKELRRNSTCNLSHQKIAPILIRLREVGALEPFDLNNQRRNQYGFVEGVWVGPVEQVYKRVENMLK